MKYKLIDDNSNTAFLEPIPKWVTHFGFIIMIIVFIIIVYGTTMINYTQSIEAPTTILPDQIYSTFDKDKYQIIAKVDTIQVIVPISNVKVNCILQHNELWLKGDKIIVPLKCENGVISKLNYKENIFVTGHILVSRESILLKILKELL